MEIALGELTIDLNLVIKFMILMGIWELIKSLKGKNNNKK